MTRDQIVQLKTWTEERDRIMHDLITVRREKKDAEKALKEVYDAKTVANKELEKINDEIEFKKKFIFKILADVAAGINSTFQK